MMLYHYTSTWHLRQILKDGYLKLTPSNLIQPHDLRIVNGRAISSTDSIKPVVWLTTIEDFDRAAACGLAGSAVDKTEVRITVDTSKYPLQQFYKWDGWAIRNGTDKSWFKTLKETAPEWETFYVTEQPVKILDSYPCIGIRGDVYEELDKDGEIIHQEPAQTVKGGDA